MDDFWNRNVRYYANYRPLALDFENNQKRWSIRKIKIILYSYSTGCLSFLIYWKRLCVEFYAGRWLFAHTAMFKFISQGEETCRQTFPDSASPRPHSGDWSHFQRFHTQLVWTSIGLRKISSEKLSVVIQHHAGPRVVYLWSSKDKDRAVQIRDDSAHFKLRFCFSLYTRPFGHRGAKSMELLLTNYFCSSTMSMDVRAFVKACTHCLSTIGGGWCNVLFDVLYSEPLLKTFSVWLHRYDEERQQG